MRVVRVSQSARDQLRNLLKQGEVHYSLSFLRHKRALVRHTTNLLAQMPDTINHT
jgi:hypothetical protein